MRSDTVRRRHPRATPGLLTANFRSDGFLPEDDFLEGRFATARIVDISERGLCLDHVELPVRSQVQLSIPLLDRHGRLRRCRAQGHVVRREGGRVGLAFSPLRPIHLLQLRDYVWRNSF